MYMCVPPFRLVALYKQRCGLMQQTYEEVYLLTVINEHNNNIFLLFRNKYVSLI